MLETKFRVPRRRRNVVARSRLHDRLRNANDVALTLVSAPAGFGKTTLLTDWLAASHVSEFATAWVSLDEGDNEPVLFWGYVVAALQTAVSGIGADALALLQSSPSSVHGALASLLNDLHAIETEAILVLDDYHLIDAQDIHEAVTFLVEHLPPHVHLVIASRADPALPLARLRARGDLLEIRAAELRFTPEEASTYLNEVMGLVLNAEDVATLEARTEGWIAALQLAALSMQDRKDSAEFIASFAGDDRFVVDYLVGEVLQRQPAEVRSFLLCTSILSRLTGSLCDAVTGQTGGAAMLETLDRANLFIVRLDDRRLWYRYHHLFADVLRARLLDEQPDQIHQLHRRASDWYARNGDQPAAIGHALDGEDFERAADLIEMAAMPAFRARQEATFRRWLEALPDDLFRVRPVLAMAVVAARMAGGDIEGVEARLQDIKRCLEEAAGVAPDPAVESTPMVVIDHELFGRLPNQIAIYRAGIALLRGDVAGTIAHASRALELAAEDDHLGRGSAAALLGLAHWNRGDLDAARHRYAEALPNLEKAGNLSDALGLSLALADILIVHGRLREAMGIFERGLKLASEQAPLVLRGTADMHVGMSELFRERNDLKSAQQHLEASATLGEHAGLPQNAYRSRVAHARIRQIQGDLAGAEDLLAEAERVYTGDYSPEVRPVSALRARVQLAQGKSEAALGWVHDRRLSASDALSYLREFEHITLARVLLAQDAAAGAKDPSGEATLLLERLLAAAQEGHRTGSVIEITVLQSLDHQARGDIPAASATLEQAMTLAEPEGYVRVFLDEGPAMTALLRAAAQHGERREYARYLLASDSAKTAPAPAQHDLVEPLSQRELDVLRLLRTDLSGPDIARDLTVSLHTIRTHTKSIYAKLGVNNRRAAVRRADELDL